jgi:hypothetical protein
MTDNYNFSRCVKSPYAAHLKNKSCLVRISGDAGTEIRGLADYKPSPEEEAAFDEYYATCEPPETPRQTSARGIAR